MWFSKSNFALLHVETQLCLWENKWNSAQPPLGSNSLKPETTSRVFPPDWCKQALSLT